MGRLRWAPYPVPRGADLEAARELRRETRRRIEAFVHEPCTSKLCHVCRERGRWRAQVRR